MTLRDQILALRRRKRSPAAKQALGEVLALLSEGPTPTQIEAGARGLARWWDIEDSYNAPHDPDEADYQMAEAVLRAASEATP